MAYEDVGNDTPILETDISNKKVSYLGLLSDIDPDYMTNTNPDIESFNIISDNEMPHDSVERFGSAVVGIVSAEDQSTPKDTADSPQHLPVNFDHIGAFIDMDSAEVCSYDAMAARKLIADCLLERLTPRGGFIVGAEGLDFSDVRRFVMYDDAGMPKLVLGQNSIYQYTLNPGINAARKIIFWTDVEVPEKDKELVRTYQEKVPLRFKFGKAVHRTAEVVRREISNDSPLHIGYSLQGNGRELILPLATLRKTETGCEFLVPSNQEMNSEAYNKPRLLETLRASLKQIVAIHNTDSVDETNAALLPFVKALIDESKDFVSSKVFTDTLASINGLRPEDFEVREFYEKTLYREPYSSRNMELLTVVTTGDNNESVTLQMKQNVIARSKQFKTKIGAKEQETEAIITEGVLNEQLHDGFRTETFTVYMGPAKEVFGDVRYYPAYEVTKDEFGQLTIRRYKNDLKTLEPASTDDVSALHMLFVKK